MRRVTWFRFAAVGSLSLVGALAACADDGNDANRAVAVFAGDPAPGDAASADAYQPGDTVEFHATEFEFSPQEFVAEPGVYTGVFINDGNIEHDITFENGEPIVAGAGESVEFEFTVPEGGISFLCSIPGHSDAGMTGIVRTPSSSTDGAAAAAGDAGGHGGSAPASVEADPGAPPYELRNPTVPARGEGPGVALVAGGAPDGGDLIEVELEVVETMMTVAEGYQQRVWTFGGTVPGPVLRTEVGDTVRVHLVNPAESEVSHSIDYHASQVAWNDEMRSIAPGEDLVYEFTTDYAGVWMYHCGTDPVLHH
ncbi:MAG TPA: multicopper oxidase domain-containing protein, partial [Ilumatobacteraceae bacterium]